MCLSVTKISQELVDVIIAHLKKAINYVFACVCLSVSLSVCVSVTKISKEWMIESLSNFQDIISSLVGQTD